MKKKILIAEDDPSIIEALTYMLEDEGYAVDCVDGKIELDGDKTKHPDLILLDILMSGVDGRTVCKKLKSKEETKKIPVIIISANRRIKEIAHEAGADDFIIKPFDMDELLQKIEAYTAVN
ncbi:MAG: response regulator transcription factor [Candidatus Levyibacteriota bacterium]